ALGLCGAGFLLNDGAPPRQVALGADALAPVGRLVGETVLLKAARPAALPRRLGAVLAQIDADLLFLLRHAPWPLCQPLPPTPSPRRRGGKSFCSPSPLRGGGWGEGFYTMPQRRRRNHSRASTCTNRRKNATRNGERCPLGGRQSGRGVGRGG